MAASLRGSTRSLNLFAGAEASIDPGVSAFDSIVIMLFMLNINYWL
jgi:hypothetical protein